MTGNDIRGRTRFRIPPAGSVSISDLRRTEEAKRSIPHVPSVPSVPSVASKSIPFITNTSNPYKLLDENIISDILRERDVFTEEGTTLKQKIMMLMNYDEIDPEWIESCRSCIDYKILGINKLYVYAACGGINLCQDYGNTRPSEKELKTYIKADHMLKGPERNNFLVMRPILQKLTRTSLKVLFRKLSNVSADHTRFISESDMIDFIVTRNDSYLRNNDAVRRYELLTNHCRRNLIAELYHINDEEDWITVSKQKPSPMENVILDLDKYTDNQIIETFGIAVPIQMQNSIREYITSNIVLYSEVLTRESFEVIPLDVCLFTEEEELSNYLQKLKDTEIFSSFGIYVPYQNRRELISNIISVITEPSFMFPCVRSKIRSINTETLMLSDVTDPDIFVVCYGTALRYYTYELEDLIVAFSRSEETLSMEFRKPEDHRNKFKVSDLEALIRLLECFPPDQKITTLINKINEGIITAREKLSSDYTNIILLHLYDAADKALINGFLHQTFFIGMYMRRWEGPGHPYPLSEKDTKNKPEPDDKVTLELGKALEMLKNIDVRNFCLNLECCQYTSEGDIEQSSRKFEKIWTDVIKGEACIRMASTEFIGTALHYLRVLFSENITGINVKSLDRIF